MNPRLLLFSFLLIFGCTKKMNFSPDDYLLLKTIPSELSEIQKLGKKSKAAIQINLKTGEFSGKYGNKDFSGKYNIEHTSAGFAKGFYYRVSLDSLSKPNSSSEKEIAFFDNLAKCKKISFMPDVLANPSYFTIEMSNPESESILEFVKIKH